MKSILLATTALVAFAGAAAADGHTSIGFTGNAEVGYNDSDPSAVGLANADYNDDEQGFYWNTDIDVTMSATLDNGLTAGASFELDILNDTNGEAISSDEFVVSLESETAGLFVGDTSFAAETRWVSAGDMEGDSFSSADGENVVRGDIAIGGIEASVSYAISDANGNLITDDPAYDEDVDQLSFGIAGEFGMFTVAAAYQEESAFDAANLPVVPVFVDPENPTVTELEAQADFDAAYNPGDANGDFTTDEVFGVSVGIAVAGADITVAYAEETNSEQQSTGIKVAYPFGPVTLTGYYVDESAPDDLDPTTNENDPNYGINVAYSAGAFAVTGDYQDDQGTEKWALEGSFDTGAGVSIFAGVLNDNEGDDEDYYVAATYDLGGGAEILVSYAEDDDGDNEDEIGDGDYQLGTTIELSFAF